MKRVSFGLIALLSLAASPLSAADWQPIAVPGAWEEKGPSAARQYDGIAWYRTWVKVPDSYFTPHARNLFEESVGVNVRDLADAHEIYVNGVKIGAGGAFPPSFRSGRDQFHRHKVPVGTLRKGEWNEIAIRVYNASGPGGFLGEAPFIMNYFMESVFEGTWEFRLGDGYQPGGAVATKPAASAFDQFRESNRVLGRSAEFFPGPRLPPEESHAKMKSAEDLRVDLLLHEPTVAQPNHLSFDERGRLWVTQYRQYPYPAGLTMVSRDKYYRSHYDRTPPAPPNHDRGADIVSIHEDTDGDGVFDKHTVFQDGLNMATAAVRGRGGVWVMHPPYLLFYPDADFDDVPDGPPTVHLQGFGLEDTHSVANGLVWGADGWLYGGQGSTTSSRVTRPGLDLSGAEGVYFEGCMVWRYHPETRAYEIFAEGSGNTFGLEVDAQGRLYSGHNGGQTRGWHYVQGGFYLMQGVEPGKFGPPRNPYAFGVLPMMATTHNVVRFSHFGAYAEGTALPARFQGHLFAIDPLHNAVINVERRVQGATFVTTDIGRQVTSDDVAFRPVFIANAPDGSLYVADFYEYYIAHGQHYQNQIDPTSGRIYRIRGREQPLERDTNLFAKSTDQLIALLSHPNKWHRHTAGRVLGERKDPAAVSKLQWVLKENRDLGALNAFWALMQMDAVDEATVRSALEHPYAPVRLWAVQWLGNRYGVNRGLGLPGIGQPARAPGLPRELATKLLAQARTEPDAEVRSQMAGTARRLPTEQALAFVKALGVHAEDVQDPYIPLMVWWILEAHVYVDRPAVVSLFRDPELWRLPLVKEHVLPRVMRRFALEGRRQDWLLCAELLRLAPSPAEAEPLMKGFEEAFRGRPMAGLPDELLQALAAVGQSPLILRVRQSEPAAVQEALAIVGNTQAKVEERVLYARAFGEVREARAVPMLLEVAAANNPLELRRASLASLAAYDAAEIGPRVAALLKEENNDLRTAALAVLASRASWSLALLEAVQSGQLPGRAVPPEVVDRLRGHQDERVARAVAQVFPTTAPGGQDWNRRIAEVEAKLKQGTGNPYAGEELYLQTCASCHKLFFKGGNLGPDLTAYQRDNLGTMLISIINPNAEIREGYEYYLVETKDGRTLSGFLVERDTQVVVLRGLEGADITLRQSEIKNLQSMGRSLMPEGLLDGLTDQQIRDLFAYLRISQPITR